MIEFSLQHVATICGGRLVGSDRVFKGISTDSRTIAAGELFVALKGPHFDGHDCVREAATKGALGAVVETALDADISRIEVADTRLALGDLARAWRRHFAIPVVGITGSNGKTTTKEMCASILAQRGPTLATRGNLNNDIGVPLTLFQLARTHTAAVIEMGANSLNNIADLCAIAEPTVGVVTMCGPAHLTGFGSIERVAEAKGKMYPGLAGDGVAVLNEDDRFADYWRGCAGTRRIITFGLKASAAVHALEIECDGPGRGTRFLLKTPLGETAITLPFDGVHNVYNALASAAIAVALDCQLPEIRAGLALAKPVKGRLTYLTADAGFTLIDDTYNANPASLKAALEVLRQSAERKWLVLGDMAELGANEINAHEAAGEWARDCGVERVFVLGDLARHACRTFGSGARHFNDRTELAHAVLDEATAGVTILLKGSRVMQLDTVVAQLLGKVA